MREQQGSGEAPGRRGGAVRSLLGVERRLVEGGAEGAAGVPSGKQAAGAAAGGGEKEERKAVVRVVAADMPPALQRRAFRCARDELAAMPRYPRRLEPKRLALALKKVWTDHSEPAHTVTTVSANWQWTFQIFFLSFAD